MSPKSKQSRRSQRKKAKGRDQSFNQDNQEMDISDSNTGTPRKDGKQGAKPTKGKVSEKGTDNLNVSKPDPTDAGVEPCNKKMRASETSLEAESESNGEVLGLHPASPTSLNTSSSPTASDSSLPRSLIEMEEENLHTEVLETSVPPRNDSQDQGKSPPPPAPKIIPPQPNWELFLKRFDKFECTIKSTIQEEIRESTSGLQSEVRSLHARVDHIEESTVDGESKISKLGQALEKNTSQLKVLKREILEEVDKQVASKIGHIEHELQKNKGELAKISTLEKELQDSKAEVARLKDGKTSQPNQNVESLQRDFLIEKCFARRCNLMLMGLEEPKELGDEKDNIATLLHNRLGITKPKIIMTYRMGQTAGKSPRPILITFANFPQKLSVWYKKGNLNKDQETKLWLQEDLPKPLRAELNTLLKVQKKAKSMPKKYPDVKIKEFKIRIQGRLYGADELEKLPDDLQPSAIATPQSESTVVFFGRASPLSNHHICEFTIAGRKFTCVEHFLAWQRANVAEDHTLAESVLTMEDPAEHKRVLNSLKEINPERWSETVESVLNKALKAKFQQNPHLRKFLCDTHPKRLGEASTNPKWGVGMSLTHAEVLDVKKWNSEGNLLGRSLESIRQDLLQEITVSK